MSNNKAHETELMRRGATTEQEKNATGESLAGGTGRDKISNDCMLSYRVKRQKSTEANRQQYDERVPSAGWRAVYNAMGCRW